MGKPHGQGRYAALRLAVAGLRTIQLSILLASVLLAWEPGAYALDPALDVSQYAHTAWKVRDGFTQGAISAIAQTPDGYLWVGTELGLYRFDGVRAARWQPPAGQQLPDSLITALLVARDGTLWIGTLKGLVSWKDGKLTKYPEVAGFVLALLQDRDETVWVTVSGPGRVCAIRGREAHCDGEGRFGNYAVALYKDGKGSLWVTSTTGVWRWKPGPPKQYTFPRGTVEVNSVLEIDSGTLLLATNDGLKELVDGKIQSYALPGVTGKFRPLRLFRSSDGSLWISATDGLIHLHQGKTDAFGVSDGLSGDDVVAIFEDREGNIWVSTLGGLDRFREYAVRRVGRNQGLSSSDAYSLQATPDDAIWIGTSTGLNRWANGHVTVYGSRGARDQVGGRIEGERRVREWATPIANSGLAGTSQSLGQDDRERLWVSTGDGIFYFGGTRFIRVPGVQGGSVMPGISGDGHGKVWIGDSAGLVHLRPGDVAQPIPWSQFGEKNFGAQAFLPDRSDGGLWLGFLEGGIAYFKDGQVRASYTAADGLGSGRVDDLRFGSRGTLWAATEGGLSRIKDGNITTLTSKNGLPCDAVHWSMEDDDQFVWLYMPCGLVRIARSELDAGMADPSRRVQRTIFDSADGVSSLSTCGGYGPHVTKSPDGKIWFIPYGGVSIIDPRHLPYNKVPPPVHIEQITADGKEYDAARRPLPPLVRDLSIDYTGLSLAVPQKVRFRVKLEGQDKDWRELVNVRHVEYTNLAPKHYRFLVKACNNSGVWNEAGDTLDFSIAPAYYQTRWFQLACVAAFLVSLWALYHLRLRQLAREFNAGLEARVNERTRIARELHDSLLQGFQGLMFRLQAVRDMLPGRASEAMRALDTALERGDKAIAEGRDTVSDLREPIMGDSDIAQALTALGKELALQSGNGLEPCVRVLLEGKQRELNPMLRDEIYRIAREALRNAFRHARAQKIEAEITYSDSEFLLHVRDDGGGIDPEVANQGARAGHWGLPGMRERAKSFGGKLEVWSEHGAGTEIELSVPGAIAYGKSEPRRRFWLWRKKIGESDGQQS